MFHVFIVANIPLSLSETLIRYHNLIDQTQENSSCNVQCLPRAWSVAVIDRGNVTGKAGAT